MSRLALSRFIEGKSLLDTALVTLTVVFGLQELRVLLTGLVFYIRDSLGAHTAIPGVYALALFLIAFLAARIYRLLGPRRALLLTAGGLALARVTEQVVPWPAADLGLSTVGTVLFILFIPIYLTGGSLDSTGDAKMRRGATLAVGLLLGMALDTSLKGVFGTLDMSWQRGAVTNLIVVAMVVLHGGLLTKTARDCIGSGDADGGFRRVLPLAALGPIIFLQLLLYQNIGQQTVLLGWDQPLVFFWLAMGNAVGVAAALAVMRGLRHGGWLAVAALGGLVAILSVGERSGWAAAVTALYGQVAVFMSVGVMGAALVPGAARPGIGGVTRSSGAGMLILLVLAFLYYSNYQFAIPGGSTVIPPIAAGLILLFVAGSLRGGRDRTAVPVGWVPAVAAIVLLVFPLGYWAAWDEAEVAAPKGLTVRVMSYNLHQGFDTGGALAMEELVGAIEAEAPDVIALQEVSRGWVIDGSFDMLTWLSRRLGMPYVWGPAADSVWGNAVLSRYPLFDGSNHSMPNNDELQLKRSFITVRVELDGERSLLVIATHLHHVEEEVHRREPQVRALLDAWDGQEATVLMGDLNARPDTPEIAMLREAGLKDAFVAATTRDGLDGRGYTSPSGSPEKRIDYIWISEDLNAGAFTISGGSASDHLAVAVTLD